MARPFLTAEWRHLVMLNWEIDPAVLQPLVPGGTELDPWQGRHYVSLVGFRFLQTRVLGLAIPYHRDFDEINLRFYVRHKAEDGWRRGVTFIKEVVPRAAIALVARWLYNENYVACGMISATQMPEGDRPGKVEYRWQVGSRWNAIRAQFRGAATAPEADSEGTFITEHYWGYVGQRDGSTLEYRVEHPPWRVWRAESATLDCDVAGFYGEPFRQALSGPPPSAFIADGSEVAVFPGRRIP